MYSKAEHEINREKIFKMVNLLGLEVSEAEQERELIFSGMNMGMKVVQISLPISY